MNRVMQSIIGGWTLAPEWRDRNGTRFTPGFSGTDTANVGRSGGRPDLLPGCNPNVGGETEFKWERRLLRRSSQRPLRNGAAGHDAGVLYMGFNLNAFKRWYLGYGETGPYFQLEAYMRNILTTPQHAEAPSSTNITSPAFGQFRPGWRPQHSDSPENRPLKTVVSG